MMDKSVVSSSALNTSSENPPHARTAMMLKNLGAGATASILKIVIQLALVPLMALLLGPREFGVYALALPVVAFLALIADGGVGLTLARDRTNAPEIWSTAFWMLLASGLILSVVVIGCGYFLAFISSEPQLSSLMLILAMSFPFLSLSVLPVARLTRSGNLVACDIANTVSTIAGAMCAICLGILGFGAKSLAFQFLIGYVFRAAILNIYAYERPAAIFRPSAILDHLSSGSMLMGGRVAELVCRAGENFVFGSIFGAATLGIYNLANQVPRFLFEAFSNPAWAALYAQSLSERRERLLQFFYKVCRLMAFVTFPTAAVLVAAGPEILAQLLGANWQQAGVFLQILAPSYALSSTASMGTALLLSLNANLIFFLTTLIVGLGRLAAVAAGHFVQPWQSVWLVTVANVVYALLVFGLTMRIANVKILIIVKELSGILISSVFSGLACWGMLKLTGDSPIAIFGTILTAMSCYFAAMFVLEGKNLKNELIFLKSALAGMVKKDH